MHVRRKRGDSNAQGCNPYLCSRQAPHPAGSLPGSCAWPVIREPRRHDSNVRSPPSEGGALSAEPRRAGVDGRIRTCIPRFRRPGPHPFGHVDVAPPTGLEPVTFCSTGSCSGRLSYGGVVVGREGIEPPVSEDGWSTASCAPWRDRPIRGPVWRPVPRRCLCSCQSAGVPTGGRARVVW